MADSDWARRLATLRTDRWELESAEERHLRYGESFWIPSEDQRRRLQPGQAVRLLFRIEGAQSDGSRAINVERMWAVVLGRVGDFYLAVLDSQPASIEPGYLDRDTEFLFMPKHVIDITDPPRDYLIERFGPRLRLVGDDEIWE
ncbi:MAG TPA: hypothetical protein VFK05_28635 [Polyangiaceae bacterium]|nr:hypothetical protein [Polyangiaceae bacterium]